MNSGTYSCEYVVAHKTLVRIDTLQDPLVQNGCRVKIKAIIHYKRRMDYEGMISLTEKAGAIRALSDAADWHE